MRFGDHAGIDFNVAVVNCGDDVEVMGSGAIGCASRNHGAIGQVESDLVLDGAVGGLFELVEGANNLAILDNLIALGLDHAAAVSFDFAVGVVGVTGYGILIDHGA